MRPATNFSFIQLSNSREDIFAPLSCLKNMICIGKIIVVVSIQNWKHWQKYDKIPSLTVDK